MDCEKKTRGVLVPLPEEPPLEIRQTHKPSCQPFCMLSNNATNLFIRPLFKRPAVASDEDSRIKTK